VFLVAVGALVIKQPSIREEAKLVPVEENPRIASEVTAPAVDTISVGGPKTDEPNAKNCEKELRRAADLLRFSVNRIQPGEETQSVVADMRQQAERVSVVCPELSDR
jgi:hypothetical protein